MEIEVPFLKRPVGSGDIVKAAAESVGIQQSGDCGCRKRQAAMNSGLTFTPRKGSAWPEYPGIAEGWSLVASCGAAVLYTDGRKFMVFNIEGGRYKRAHGSCCSEELARKELGRRCR